MRLFPFTHISIELQGNKFDDPNRLFFSVKQSFFNSTTQKTDVRELIPEFFYFPEIFLNINELNMGIKDDGTRVNDVITPCDNNPYEFIFTMKKILEGEHVSRKIRKWIDLIFGYKARGKDSELAYNIFTESSYQENIDINNVENKESYLRLVEFGLIPTQIMNKECIKKEKKEDILKGKEVTNSKGKFIYEKCKVNFEVTENIPHPKSVSRYLIGVCGTNSLSRRTNFRLAFLHLVSFVEYSMRWHYQMCFLRYIQITFIQIAACFQRRCFLHEQIRSKYYTATDDIRLVALEYP